MTYCKSGELLTLIQRVGNFHREGARFYTGEMVRALEHLHSLRIIHRYVHMPTHAHIHVHTLPLYLACHVVKFKIGRDGYMEKA